MFEFWPQVGRGGRKVNIMKMFKIVARTLLTGVIPHVLKAECLKYVTGLERYGKQCLLSK